MKKNITLSALLLILALLFAGCGKKKEWSYLFGYTVDDIAGTYTYSNIEDAFETLTENDYCHICPDAEVTITKLTDETIKFKINCPEENFSREWVGKPTKTNGDFMIRMSSGYQMRVGTKFKSYNLSSSVYQNENQDTRLHGFASICKYEVEFPFAPADSTVVDTVLTQAVNYYFDMIKD